MQRILEAHANVKDLNFVESKLNFIKAWQALPEYGVSLFVVKLAGSKREVCTLVVKLSAAHVPRLSFI